MSVFRVRDKDGNIVEIPALVIAMSKSECYCSIPKYAHAKTGDEFRVYFRNVISLESAKLWVGSHSDLVTRYYEDYLSIIPTSDGVHDLKWKLYDDGGNLLDSGVLTIIASAKTATKTTTALVIGDSTVNAGVMTQAVMDLFADDGATLNLLGTRGTAPNLHEGRGGWAAYHYTHTAEDGTYTNPFLHGGVFDFGKYMAEQGFTDLQVVVIQLGINDVFSWKDTTYKGEQVLGYLDTMVDSILAYDSNIKIVFNLPTTPNSNGESFTATYGTDQLFWVYNRNIIRFASDLMDHFGGNESVIISGANCVLDTQTQIRDGVHPTAEGYEILGERLYEVLVNVVDGVAGSLLTVDREYVVNRSTTITATMPRELEFEKCYATGFAGVRGSASAGDPYELISRNSLSYTATEQTYVAGRGIEFPVALEAGKTYRLSYTANETNAKVYLLKYNADTTFNSYELLGSANGDVTATITPEEGYIYTVMFTPVFAGAGVWTNINLVEMI